jgi:hypothetical protein
MKRIFSVLMCFFCLSPLTESWAQNQLPQANLKFSHTLIEVGKPITLQAEDSRKANRIKTPLQYRFKTQQNTPWSDFSYRSDYTFTPQETGKFTAQLEVLDVQKKTRSKTILPYQVRWPFEKNARIEIEGNKNVRIGEEVIFHLIYQTPTHTDKKNIESRWDFDNDGVFETPWIRDQTISYVYGELGNFRPRAMVRFPDGDKLEITGIEPIANTYSRDPIPTNQYDRIRVQPASITAPNVLVSPGSQGYTEDTVFTFDASRTKLTTQSWIEFYFPDGKKIVGQTKVQKKFESSGTKEVLIRHCYRRSKPICAESTLSVKVDRDPTDFRANILMYNKTHPWFYQNAQNENTKTTQIGDEIHFSAQIFANDSLANRYEYRWDFEGDGHFDTPFSLDPHAQYTYTRAGKFSPQVEIKNEFTREKEQRATAQKILWVEQNSKPTGNFVIQKYPQFSYQNLEKDRVYVGENVYLRPQIWDQSAHPNHLQVRFDVEGDGQWDSDFRYGGTFAWKFEKSGVYKTRMEIQDPEGQKTRVEKNIIVYPVPETKIKILVSKKNIQPGEIVTFDARESQGLGLRYQWSLSEQPNAFWHQNSPYLRTRFSTPGEKKITLEVLDQGGHKKTAEFLVWVHPIES